jgi:hypothetical protein
MCFYKSHKGVVYFALFSIVVQIQKCMKYYLYILKYIFGEA